MKNKGLFIVLLLVGFLGITGVVMYFSYSNKYITLKNLYEAQVSQDKIVYDEVWKIVKQQAGVSEKYSEDFRKNYQAIMNSRNYGGEMMKWITEQNPNFTPDLYSKLMNTIEGERIKFTSVQSKLISYHQEIKNAVQLFPGSLFIGNREIPKLEIVTSSQTEEVFNTAKEDNVELFKKDSTK